MKLTFEDRNGVKTETIHYETYKEASADLCAKMNVDKLGQLNGFILESFLDEADFKRHINRP